MQWIGGLASDVDGVLTMKGNPMVRKVLLALLLVTVSTGCLGRAALTKKVKQANLEVTENRYGREGIFLGLSVLWVYRVCTVLDLLVFNSIEFWSGENPINGASPLVDVPMSQVKEMGLNDVDRARIERVSANDAKLYLEFKSGDNITLDVTREDKKYTVSFLGKEVFKGELKDSM